MFGTGGGGLNHFSAAEDVVAHEYTHAVTQYTGDMIYQFEQGALNESISDIFGVFIQQRSTGNFNDWELGEGIGTVFRDMSNPTLYGDPDHVSLYQELGLAFDLGGVHINSGIPNKAAYLMVTGGTAYGVPVTGIGLDKTEQIFYAALTNYLSPLSGFRDARDSTIQACNDLIGQFGIIAANCDQVQNAWAAVGVGSAAAGPALPVRLFFPAIMRNDAPTIYEPNDDVSTAFGPLLSGQAYQAYLQTNGDIDIYHFTTSGGTISVSLSSLPPGTDYDLDLYNGNGLLLGRSMNLGTTPEGLTGPVSAGQYFIYVYPKITASSTSDPYQLLATFP